MNLDQAVKNIDTVLQNTRMTRPEHIELDSNLKLLVGRAKLANGLEDKLAGNTELSDKLEIEIANLKKRIEEFQTAKAFEEVK